MPPAPDDLAARLKGLEDERGIIARLHAVCFAVDGTDEAAWLDAFTPHGVFTWRATDEAAPALDLRGHEALAGWFKTHRTNNPIGSQMHIVLHPIVTVSGDEARAKTAYETLRMVDGQILVASTGRYDDRLVRSADGSWRLAEHHAIGSMMRQAAPARG